VQRLVDRQQMRQEPALRVDQAVDPLDPDRPAPARLDGERRVVEGAGVVDRPIAPHRGRGQAHARRQDALAELTHSDLEVLDAPAAPPRDRARAWHGRGNHQRRLVLRDRARVEHPDHRRMRERLAPRGPPQHNPRAGTRPVLEKPSPRDRAHDPDPQALSAPSQPQDTIGHRAVAAVNPRARSGWQADGRLLIQGLVTSAGTRQRVRACRHGSPRIRSWQARCGRYAPVTGAWVGAARRIPQAKAEARRFGVAHEAAAQSRGEQRSGASSLGAAPCRQTGHAVAEPAPRPAIQRRDSEPLSRLRKSSLECPAG
jgi:hypothetical protein